MNPNNSIKLLISFGGKFITKQDKPVYTGGKTRLISVNKSSSFQSILSKMSEICGADLSSIDVKFQLPDGSMDSRLVSVENDEDLRCMLDEFENERKIPIFLFVDNENEEEEEEDCLGDFDGFDIDFVRDTSMLLAEEPYFSLSGLSCASTSSKRDYLKVAGPNMAGEVLLKDSQSLVIGQEYEDVQTFRNALTSAAIASNFELHIIRSDQRRVTARCAAQNCTWRVHASKLPQVNTFRIRTLTPDHTCVRQGDAGHKQANAKWIANCIKEKLRQNIDYKPREILNDIHRDYGVCITYKRAFLGREKALEELRAEPIKDMVPSVENYDEEVWGEIHDPPRKKRVIKFCNSKEVRPLHCTRCNQTGHNRRTCNMLELHQDGAS